MAQERTNKMEPVVWANAPFTDVLAAQDFLPDQSHHHRVLGIVIGRITVGDVLHRGVTNECDDVRVGRLQHAICVYIHGLQFAHESFDDDLRRIKHDAHQRLEFITMNQRAFDCTPGWPHRKAMWNGNPFMTAKFGLADPADLFATIWWRLSRMQ